MEPLVLTVDDSIAGERLDSSVYRLVDDLPSRSFAAKMIDTHFVTLNDKNTKPSAKLKLGDRIQIDLSPLEVESKANPEPEAIDLEILFEDADILVINKKSGMVVHPGAGVKSGTLVNAVLSHCGHTLPSLGGNERAGIVHRLDRDTSGVMIVAKSQVALTELSKQFAAHTQKRVYRALTYSSPLEISGTLEDQLGRDPRNRLRYAVVQPPNGKHAKLDFHVAQIFGEKICSEIYCELHTGRTHQIRVQLTALSCPLLGDPLYGRSVEKIQNQKEIWSKLKSLLNGQMLHAEILGIVHPRTGESLLFSCPPRADYLATLDVLEQLGIEKLTHPPKNKNQI